MLKKILTYILILGTLVTSKTWAQTDINWSNASFSHLGIEQGLSQSLVFDIHQSKEGYLWFATQDGLNRYDGYTLTIFRNRLADSTSLSHNDVHDINEDIDGNLWIATAGGGLNKYDIISGEFKSYRSDIDNPTSISSDQLNNIYIDHDRMIWIGTQGGGLNLCDPVTEKFSRYMIPDEPPENLRSNSISHIFEDSRQQLWIGTEYGLYQFDTEKKLFKRKSLFQAKEQFKVSSILEDDFHNLWLGIEGWGLVKYSLLDGSLKHYDLQSSPSSAKYANRIRSIKLISSGHIAVGSFGGGLGIFNPVSGDFISLKNSPKTHEVMINDHVFTLLEDHSQILWIGTFKGIFKLDLKPRKFKNFKIFNGRNLSEPQGLVEYSNFILSIIKDRNGDTWCGTLGGGLYRIDAATQKVFNYRSDTSSRNGLLDNYIWALAQDFTGRIWVGSGQGLYHYDKGRDRFVVHNIEHGSTDRENLVRSIFVDRKGNLWIGFFGAGLNRYDPESKVFESFQYLHMRPDQKHPYLILTIFEDQQGMMWVGTDGGGLVRFNPDDRTFYQYQHNSGDIRGIGSPRVNDINEDKAGYLWVGTSNGLVILSPNRKDLVHYSEKDGLSNSFIYAIEKDRTETMWVSTNRGLTRIMKNINIGLVFRNFDVEDGLQSNEFNTNCSFSTTPGELLFGGISGFISFYPENVQENPIVPAMSITNFIISEKKQVANPNKSMVEVRYADNTITIEFAALEFTNSSKNIYKYKLEGFDENWVSAGTRRFTTYTNLNPGSYTFRVQGTNNDGIWSEEDAWVDIVIVPPLWRTIWAYLLYMVVVAFGVLLFIRLRERKHEKAKRILEKSVEDKTIKLRESYKQLERSQEELLKATQMKAIGTMASGMAHSFNNLLMIILSSSQLLKEKFKSVNAEKEIQTIEQAATDGADIIKKLQKFGRTESENSISSVHLNEIIKNTIEVSRFKWSDQKQMQGISINFKTNYGDIPPVIGKPSELHLVFVDIILNAIESHRSSGIIEISTYKENEMVITEVKDEGVGMAKETVDQIFDPFYSTWEGSEGSLGLSQVYSIINQHGGTINIESGPDRGTSVIIRLPAGPQPVNEEKPEETSENNSHLKKIFIVEDEQMLRELYTEILTIKGHKIVSFPSGEEALKSWKKGMFKLLICDLGLPGMNGWEFIFKIRETDTKIPVIVLTGWGNEIGEERMSEHNVQRVLAKPVTIDILTQTINELCK